MIEAREQGEVKVADIRPDLLRLWLDAGDAVLVDVREDYEFAEERIDGAVHHPLSSFDADAVRSIANGRRVVFQCRTGKRSADAAARFRVGVDPVFHLAGGIEAWKSAGEPVVRPSGGPRIPMMRQVMLAAGGLVLAGVVLGFAASPWFFGLAAFVGCGLMFAGLTGWCGMAKLLSLAPWNRASRSCCSA